MNAQLRFQLWIRSTILSLFFLSCSSSPSFVMNKEDKCSVYNDYLLSYIFISLITSWLISVPYVRINQVTIKGPHNCLYSLNQPSKRPITQYVFTWHSHLSNATCSRLKLEPFTKLTKQVPPGQSRQKVQKQKYIHEVN